MSKAVRAFVEGLAYAEDLCYNADLVVSEAMTNVMVHGFKDTRPEPLGLIVTAFQHGIAVLIEDHGSRIPLAVLDNMRHVQTFQQEFSLSELPEGGMGLALIRAVSRRFTYRVTPTSNRLLVLL